MKLLTRYEISLQGHPSGAVQVLPEPEVLYIPLQSKRFKFSTICVKEGQRVQPGEVLASDADNYCVPLLAPRAGTVRLESAKDHIVLEDITKMGEEPLDKRENALHVPKDNDSMDVKRHKLLMLGAWKFFYDAHTQALPDPSVEPRAVIVSTLNLDPFGARGDVQIKKRLSSFTRGLEHLQSLLEYQPIYLVLPEADTEFARKVHELIRGYAWCKVIHVPLKYPYDNFALIARSLGLQREADNPVWAMRAEGVLAIDRALTLSKSCDVKIVSLGGPAVREPVHLKVMLGYPIKDILNGRIDQGPKRIIDGGILTGDTVDESIKGLETECTGLTILDQQVEREMLGFVRPGCDRRSYSKCFTSILRGIFPERLTTGLRGELRPCIGCGSCEKICPARIMPHLIHKMLYTGELEDVDLVRVDLCVRCGLCSFVCPSKIDLRGQFVEAQINIANELHAQQEVEK